MRKFPGNVLPIATALSLMALAGPTLTAHAQEPPNPPPPPPAQTPAQPPVDPNAPKLPDAIDTATKDVRLRRFVKAIEAAGLTETLKGQGPYTILAPVDSAFGRLPEGAFDDLMKPENKEKLVAVLKYHIIPGRLTAADIAQLGDTGTLKTLSGQTIALRTMPRLRLNNAGIIASDVIVGNGVIHLLDTVLVPPPPIAPIVAEPEKPAPPPPGNNTGNTEKP